MKSIDKIIVLQNKFNLEKLYKKYLDFKKIIGSNKKKNA